MHVAERHQRNVTMIQLFARLMVGEMAANAAKGDWVNMHPMELVREVTHHVDKLVGAMLSVSRIVETPYRRGSLEVLEAQQFVLEHAADLANICWMIAVIMGRMMDAYAHPTDPPALDSLSSLVVEAENVLTLVAQMRTRQTTPSTSPRMPEIRAAAEQLVDDTVAGLLPRLRAHLGALVAKQAAV